MKPKVLFKIWLQDQKSPSYPLRNWWKSFPLPSLSKYTSLITFAFCSFHPSEAFCSALKRPPNQESVEKNNACCRPRVFLNKDMGRVTREAAWNFWVIGVTFQDDEITSHLNTMRSSAVTTIEHNRNSCKAVNGSPELCQESEWYKCILVSVEPGG